MAEQRMRFLGPDGKTCCSGDPQNFCTACKAAAAKILASSSTTRSAAEFRTTSSKYDPPDPYAAGIAALRASLPTVDHTDRLRAMAKARNEYFDVVSVAATRGPARGNAHLNPPDPYAEALKALKEAGR